MKHASPLTGTLTVTLASAEVAGITSNNQAPENFFSRFTQYLHALISRMASTQGAWAVMESFHLGHGTWALS